MTKRFEKKFRISMIGVMALIIISLAGVTGCSLKESINEDAVNKEATVQETSGNLRKSDKTNSDEATEKKDESSGKPQNTKPDNEENSLTKYTGLLGLSKEKLISTLNEKPNSVDEGGLEFKEAGIRVWFDQKSHTFADQIFIMGKNIDLNGVKTGEKISGFKEVFGNPVSDKNGDAHFKFKDIFLSVNYDTKTGQTFSVYILKNDF